MWLQFIPLIIPQHSILGLYHNSFVHSSVVDGLCFFFLFLLYQILTIVFSYIYIYIFFFFFHMFLWAKAFYKSCCCCLAAKLCLTLLRPRGLQPSRLLCPWDFPGKNTGVGCHFLLQGIFRTRRLNPFLLHWQADSLPLSHQGSPFYKSSRL